MRHLRFSLIGACVLSAVWAALSGCNGRPAEKTDVSPPVVAVSKPIERSVADYVDFTGRTDAQFSTDIRAASPATWWR